MIACPGAHHQVREVGGCVARLSRHGRHRADAAPRPRRPRQPRPGGAGTERPSLLRAGIALLSRGPLRQTRHGALGPERCAADARPAGARRGGSAAGHRRREDRAVRAVAGCGGGDPLHAPVSRAGHPADPRRRRLLRRTRSVSAHVGREHARGLESVLRTHAARFRRLHARVHCEVLPRYTSRLPGAGRRGPQGDGQPLGLRGPVARHRGHRSAAPPEGGFASDARPACAGRPAPSRRAREISRGAHPRSSLSGARDGLPRPRCRPGDLRPDRNRHRGVPHRRHPAHRRAPLRNGAVHGHRGFHRAAARARGSDLARHPRGPRGDDAAAGRAVRGARGRGRGRRAHGGVPRGGGVATRRPCDRRRCPGPRHSDPRRLHAGEVYEAGGRLFGDIASTHGDRIIDQLAERLGHADDDDRLVLCDQTRA